ncbi:tetratricopeptide repeat protein [Aestuariispira ectoiniformans]|uniref:tetratricopeptide repeat protein n=1 Tax=Aestuariispira ectoiniformans TaxID=2775080 RepID=UPI00223B8353|nr:tetratricopeptide repeat protein [Aestuariispira ectoiniformans]
MDTILLTLKLKRKMEAKRSEIKVSKLLLKIAKKTFPVFFIFALVSCDSLTHETQNADQPLNAEHLIALGDRANESGDWKTAITFYQQAHLTTPGSPAPLLAMAKTFEEAGSYSNAARVYYQLSRMTGPGQKVPMLIKTGQNWLKAQEADQAITVLNEAQALAPDNASISVGLGIGHDLKAEFSTAQAIYEDVLKRHPENRAAANNLGLSYLFTGDTDLAIRQLAALGDTAGPQHRFNLAMAYGMAGRMGEAEKLLRESGMDTNVKENLAAFERLRTMSPEERAAFIYGSQLKSHTTAAKSAQ